MQLLNFIQQYEIKITNEEIKKLLSEELELDISLIAMKIYEIQNKILLIKDEKIEIIMTALLYAQRSLCGCEISPLAKIGKNLMIIHHGGITIGGGTIGDNCKVHSGVVIGDRNNNLVCPIIGNNVTIYANSVVYGNITIGNNVIIMPCSVIGKSIESGKIVYGSPKEVCDVYNR